MNDKIHTLSAVITSKDWKTYHDIRRRILWENRGKFGVYQANHPDEYHPNNHPMLLYCKGVPVGVVRIDLNSSKGQAIIRRVAIIETEQRKGHGRKLVQLVEAFARLNACNQIVVASAEDASVFYKKCGYRTIRPGSRKMVKTLN